MLKGYCWNTLGLRIMLLMASRTFMLSRIVSLRRFSGKIVFLRCISGVNALSVFRLIRFAPDGSSVRRCAVSSLGKVNLKIGPSLLPESFLWSYFFDIWEPKLKKSCTSVCPRVFKSSWLGTKFWLRQCLFTLNWSNEPSSSFSRLPSTLVYGRAFPIRSSWSFASLCVLR